MTTMTTKVEVYDEDDCLHFFDADVWDALLAVGLVRVENGVRRFVNADVDFGRFPELAVCDFCHARPVMWDISADTFSSRLRDWTSVGGWAACDACGRAVLRGDRRELQRRTLAFVRTQPNQTPWPLLVAMHLDVLELFWRHLKGVKRMDWLSGVEHDRA
jgi:hypothetical protein